MVGKLTSDAVMSCSRLPALMGLSPYSTPNDELQTSFNALNGVERPEWLGNEATAWGNLMEPMILEQMKDRLGLEMLYIPDTPYHAPPGIALSGSLDGVGSMLNPKTALIIKHDPEKGIYLADGIDELKLSGPGALECKVTSNNPEGLPASHRGPKQLQGQMLCSGYSWGAIGVLYRGVELRIFIYRRNEVLIDQIKALVADFEIRKHGPDWYAPMNPADGIRTWSTVDDDAPLLDLPIDAIELMDNIIAAKKLAKVAEDTINEFTAGIMDLMGNHEKAQAVDKDGAIWTVKWPMRHYKPSVEKTTPAKAAYSIRLKTLDIKVTEKTGITG